MKETTPRVLVVDDERQMVSMVAFALETQGFEPDTARSAEEAWRLLSEKAFDLVVLDVTLPGASGIQLCERIRATSDVPVILLTARGEEEDRLRGLLAGADDYVTKPFSPRELALRASAVVRRTRGRAQQESTVANGPLTIDVHHRKAYYDGQALALSDVELRLLTALARRRGEVVSARELLNEVWQTAEPVGARDMIKTAVYRLRHHIGQPSDALIVTVRGAGYLMPRFDDNPSAP